MWGECGKYVENILERSVIECHQSRGTWLRQLLNIAHKQTKTTARTHRQSLPVSVADIHTYKLYVLER